LLNTAAAGSAAAAAAAAAAVFLSFFRQARDVHWGDGVSLDV
jgi:hypothetical protein